MLKWKAKVYSYHDLGLFPEGVFLDACAVGQCCGISEGHVELVRVAVLRHYRKQRRMLFVGVVHPRNGTGGVHGSKCGGGKRGGYSV